MKANRMKKKIKPDDPLAFTRQRNLPTDPTAQEHHIAKVIGGSRHRGSGSSPWKKSDASSDDFQVECKQTIKESIRVTLEWLEKISEEGAARSKHPALHLRFLNAPPTTDQDWVMIPERVFKEMFDVWRSGS